MSAIANRNRVTQASIIGFGYRLVDLVAHHHPVEPLKRHRYAAP